MLAEDVENPSLSPAATGIHGLCTCQDWPLLVSIQTSQQSINWKSTVHILNHFPIWVPAQVHTRTLYERTGYRGSAEHREWANRKSNGKIWRLTISAAAQWTDWVINYTNKAVKTSSLRNGRAKVRPVVGTVQPAIWCNDQSGANGINKKLVENWDWSASETNWVHRDVT